MAILTKPALLEAIARGEIIADPAMVQENSINVCLGPDMWIGDRTNEVYYINLHKPRKWTEVESVAYGDGRRVFILRPNELYLGTTLEAIGTTNKNGRAIVPEMRARSTTGRHGITVAMCAGVGDVGYAGRWALEIVNNNNRPVLICVGTPIAQVVFHEATPTDTEYRGKDRYQKEDGRIQFLPKAFPMPEVKS